ncbi:MAG: glycerol kinase GlpK [Ruthenibacterium sp.]
MYTTRYILAIDQSTSGTKAMLFDSEGHLAARKDIAHRQIVNEQGWVEHDGEEIYQNTCKAVADLLQESETPPSAIVAAGISNQRETGMMWTRTGKPVYHAVVWQCARAAQFCEELKATGIEKQVKEKTGLRLSPYFTAAKFGWLLQHVPQAQQALADGELLAGTMDAWLLYRLTGHHCTDYSNASRTQLFNINTLQWDSELCAWFGVPMEILPKVCDSDANFGTTTFDGVFETPIPICSVMGDSHAALFAQGCTTPGQGKATYGTGSSVMINTGTRKICSDSLVTSIAWGMQGKVQYVLEGNLNYTGAVINWLKDDLELITHPSQAQTLAESVSDTGGVYLVPSFSGFGAPYWRSDAHALLCGMSRSTKRAHIVRAAEECIAYQITDIVRGAEKAGVPLQHLRTDGGATKDSFLMQFQADMLQFAVAASRVQELSGAGVAFAAGLAVGFYQAGVLHETQAAIQYIPHMPQKQAQTLYDGWQNAVRLALQKP